MAWPWCGILLALTFVTITNSLRVGVGIADVTGPPAEITFMGYANLVQQGHGVHLRQFARAFVIEEDGKRIAFVSVDAAMMGIGVQREVINRLKVRFGETYNERNLILSGSHTHSTAGGFLMDFLFDLPILGFVKETFTAYVVGITKAIITAHNTLTSAKMEYGEAELLDANINRSPSAYLHNPPEERARFNYDVDKSLVQVRFKSSFDDQILGVINWFAVHPTSMNNTNKLVSSDNVGYASVLMEKALNGQNVLPGKGKIVCAFASTNLGDVSPNTNGPHCEYSGKKCDNEKLLCRADEKCFATGPGKDMFESTKIIATKLFETAMTILNSQGEDLTGPLDVKHQYVEMPKEEVSPFEPISQTFNTSVKVRGCLPAMGYSFAAGTTDGPGVFNFTQGTTTSNPLWDAVRDFIAEPTEEDKHCQYPKPILLATGRAKFPYEWQPHVVSCTVARIGGLFIAAVPGEFTTMSGRRLRHVVRQNSGQLAKKVVLAGLSNVYADYIATPEEYQAQRYEGASTIYGPHTLDIYLNKYSQLTKAIVNDEEVTPGPPPIDHSNSLISLVPPVFWDSAPWGKEFGDCVQQPEKEYSYGDTVNAKFVSGHPRNNLRHGRWYGAVERLESAEDDAWATIATDADWDTKFVWQRASKVLGTSYAILSWDIPVGTPPGTYRLHHFGNYKYVLGGIYYYHGFSDSFTVS